MNNFDPALQLLTGKLCSSNSCLTRRREELGGTFTAQHRIRTEDDVPVNQRYRRIPPNQFGEVKEHLQVLLERGVIRPSQSDYAYPIVLVRKKSGALCLCVDYRRLNAKTRKDAYPLVRIDESLDALGGAQNFSAIDLASAYNQISDFTTPPPGKRRKKKKK